MDTDTVTLMTYIQQPLPLFPIDAQISVSAASLHYSHADITEIQIWQDFSLQTILQRFQDLLNQTHIAADPFFESPPRFISGDDQLQAEIIEILIPRVRRSLRVAFQSLAASGFMQGLAELSFGAGGRARLINGYEPDLAFFDIRPLAKTAPNRAPGRTIVSCKWSTEMSTSDYEANRRQHRQVLSQVNFYMNQHNTRYGFIITDQELVAIRKIDRNGRLELSSPISWTAGGTATEPRLTVMLALWYIGMLASDDQNWIL